jgi:hypothetical protein
MNKPRQIKWTESEIQLLGRLRSKEDNGKKVYSWSEIIDLMQEAGYPIREYGSYVQKYRNKFGIKDIDETKIQHRSTIGQIKVFPDYKGTYLNENGYVFVYIGKDTLTNMHKYRSEYKVIEKI